MTDNEGSTSLHHSARYGSYKSIKFLVSMGTDINLKTKQSINCLHIAANYGHLHLCKTLIKKHNLDLQKPNDDGWTALHYSAQNGSYKLVKFFIDMGIHINLKATDGMNCLHIAADYGHLNLCKMLINEYNVDVQLPENDGWTALHFSAKNGSFEMVKYFINMGIDINLKTKDGLNCLHIAAHYGHLNLCKALINEYNVDVQLPDNDGWTALHFSARNGSYEIVKYFIKMGIDINLETTDGINCLHIAADQGHLNLCKALIKKHNLDLEKPNDDGWTALHYSAKNDSYELVKFFTDMGIDTNLKGTGGMNCLHIAADYGHLNLCKTLINEYNVDVQLPDNNGWTTPHFSARYGSYEIFKYFINMGIDINLKTKDGMNCLHIAAHYGHLNLCKALINEYNVDVQLPDNDGWTALHFSAENGSYEIVKYFINMGIDINLKTKHGMNCLHIAADYGHTNLCKTLMKKHNLDLEEPNDNGWTALHYSAKNDSYELVKFFTDMGIDTNLKATDGINCLHIAAEYENLNLCKTLINEYNVDVQIPDNDGWTALHFFAKNGNYEIVKYFIHMGIDINLKTKHGMNCLHIAADYGHTNLCKTLMKKHNLDLEEPNDNGWTALHYSAINDSYELVKFFTDMGIDTNLKATNGMNCLHIAAQYGHLNLCKALINEYNVDVQLPDNDGWTALHFSAENGSYEIVKYFINMGIDINLKTKHGMNCLHIAADYGHTNLCKTLMKKHNLDLEEPNDNGWTALRYSSKNDSSKLVKFFTDMGIDINLKATDGMNCLHIAADNGHLNLCKMLINEYNVDVELPDNHGWTALHFSAGYGSYELFKYFLNTGIDINLKTKDGMNCLHIAADQGHLNLCKTLIKKHNLDLEKPNDDGWTALHYSAKNDSYELVNFFTDMGIDTNLKATDEMNCLHIAADYGHLILCKTFINEYNVDVQLPDNDGWTALHFSSRNGSFEIVKYLINMGIDINLKTKHGMNCLHIATHYGHLNLCKALINEYNVDVQLPDNNGWTALHFSPRNGSYEIVKYFINMGIDIKLKVKHGINCLHIAANQGHLNLCKTLIKKHNLDLEKPDDGGWTALHYSAKSDSYKLVKIFIDMGIDINLNATDGMNCLHIAAEYGHLNLCKMLINEYNVDVELPDNDGWIALHYSARNGSYEIVKYFINMGIDINLKTKHGMNCLHIAADYGHTNLCKTLMKKHNLDLEEPNDNGWTALHYSAKNDSYELVKFFTDMGIDTNLKATDGINCLHIAAEYENLNLCKTLINEYNVDVQIPDNDG